MDLERDKLERELAASEPSALDAALAERLGAALDGSLTRTPEVLRPVEEALGSLAPGSLPAGLLERLEESTAGVAFPINDKVVAFPAPREVPAAAAPARGSGRRWGWIASAAAVALAGALSALLIDPAGEPVMAGGGGAAREPLVAGATGATGSIDPAAFQPAGFGSDLSGTDDLGVMWSDDEQPMRVVRVVYTDRIEFLNDKGERAVLEVPRVEYFVVPEKVD